MFKLRQFPVSDSTQATPIPILFEDTLCKPGLRRTCQRVTHYRGKKEKVAQAVGEMIRRELDLISLESQG